MKKLTVFFIIVITMSIILLIKWIPSMIWIIQTEQKDPGFSILFIASAVIILIDMMLLRQFRTLLNNKKDLD